MPISSTSALSGTEALSSAASKGTDSSSSATTLFGDMEAFLYLLVTQLQNQDPLDPMDTSEYTSQLVQYAEVEQAIQTNSYLETLIAQNVTSVGAQATTYMDKLVQFESTSVPLQDGYGKFSYTLDEDVATCNVTLLNSSGQVVKIFVGGTEAGRYVFEWDGTDSYGDAMEDGSYTMVINATDSSGKSVTPYTTAFGIVTGVAFDGDDVAISVGGSVICLMSNILAVHSKDQWNPKTDAVPDPVDDKTDPVDDTTDTTDTTDTVDDTTDTSETSDTTDTTDTTDSADDMAA